MSEQKFKPSASILADSLANNSRLTTMEVSFHRFVLPEFRTHRMFSMNGASSRAIPVDKVLEKIKTANVEPLHWGKNQRGMQAYEELTDAELAYARQAWKIARARAIDVAEAMVDIGVHKQIVNRLLEPFMPMTMVVSGDERAYVNLFNQRAHHAAQPEIRELAYRMQEAYQSSVPLELNTGDWHLPFYSRDLALTALPICVKACVARCARVSYNNHRGEQDIGDDVLLFNKLANANPPHLSPLEHVALVYTGDAKDRGNFCYPWLQLRKVYESKEDYIGLLN